MLLSSPACSTFSSLLLVLTHKTKKCLHYTLNTLHQTLYDTLIIHSKHAICLKSLNSQNSPSLLLSLSTVCISHRPSHSFPRSSATKSSDLSYNFFDWLVWCLFPPTGTCFFFFCLQTLPACRHFRESSPLLSLLPAPNVLQTRRQCWRKNLADNIYHNSSFTWCINTI